MRYFAYIQPFLSMSSDERIRKSNRFRSPMMIMGVVMTLFYLVLSIWLLADKNALPGIADQYRQIFAIMLLIYGVYRGWRVWADHLK